MRRTMSCRHTFRQWGSESPSHVGKRGIYVRNIVYGNIVSIARGKEHAVYTVEYGICIAWLDCSEE